MRLPKFLRRTVEVDEDEDVRRSDAFDTAIGNFWAEIGGTSGASSARLLERVWVANRCLHMNANAISTMPLRHFGIREPRWVSSPDPVWFPNGISSAMYAVVSSLYGYGDAFIYITGRYADGYPSAWTVLDAQQMNVELRQGRRYYRLDQTPLSADDMVQISRDPRGGLRGTSAIASYSPYTNGLLAAADLGRVMMGTGGTPAAVLKSQRKLTEEQAVAIQNQWIESTSLRRGAPAVLPPEIDFEQLAFSPKDLLLLDVQQFDAQVIASAFGVPASLINMPINGGLNYQTPILLLEQWWRTELRTTAVHVANALSSAMLPAGAYVEFDPYKFLAPAWKDLVDGWVAMVAGGLATAEQFQTVVLGLPPGTADVVAELSTPASAGATPADQPAEVVALRPTQVVN